MCTAAKARSANGRRTKSAIMPFASATTRASIRSSSGCLGETLEVTVKASNRDCYALGALQAAKFAARQKPGLYNMYDVLGL